MKNNRNFKEENNNSKVHAGGRDYYEYLKSMKNDNPFEVEEYAAAFITL
ncbi:MAG: hypothetical protein ACM3X7_02570 [Solirubrobacterales bacterium]